MKRYLYMLYVCEYVCAWIVSVCGRTENVWSMDKGVQKHPAPWSVPLSLRSFRQRIGVWLGMLFPMLVVCIENTNGHSVLNRLHSKHVSCTKRVQNDQSERLPYTGRIKCCLTPSTLLEIVKEALRFAPVPICQVFSLHFVSGNRVWDASVGGSILFIPARHCTVKYSTKIAGYPNVLHTLCVILPRIFCFSILVSCFFTIFFLLVWCHLEW